MKAIIIIGFVFLLTKGALANVVGSDIQNFNPTQSGIDFITVESSETLDPGILNMGFFLNYAINSLPNYEDAITQSRTEFEDSLLSTDLNFGLGLLKNWEVGMSFPQIISASSEDSNNVVKGEVAQTGRTEIRVGTKYRLWGKASGGVALLGSANFNMIENNPFAGDGAGPTYNLQLAYDRLFGKLAWGLNVGFRFRSPGDQIEPSIEPSKNQYIMSTALSYLIESIDSKIIGEIYGSFPAESTDSSTDRDVSTMEALVGIKKDFRHDLAVHLGGGSEVYHGSSSPDWRVYAGVNWVLGPLFGKDDSRKIYKVKAPLEEDPFSGAPEKEEHFVAEDILFTFGSSDVPPDFLKILRRLGEHLNKPPGFKRITVEGHTDSVGSAIYNKNLSLKRARSVKGALVRLVGLPESKVGAVGYGESRPIADNGNYQGRAKNRRVEFRIER